MGTNIRIEPWSNRKRWPDGKPWFLGIHGDVILTFTAYLNSVTDLVHPSILPLSTGECTLPHCIHWSGMVWGTWQRFQRVALASTFPRSKSEWAFVRYEVPPHSLQDLKHLLLLSWHQRTPSEILLSPCLYWSELFWWHEGDLCNIRQVVLML